MSHEFWLQYSLPRLLFVKIIRYSLLQTNVGEERWRDRGKNPWNLVTRDKLWEREMRLHRHKIRKLEEEGNIVLAYSFLGAQLRNSNIWAWILRIFIFESFETRICENSELVLWFKWRMKTERKFKNGRIGKRFLLNRYMSLVSCFLPTSPEIGSFVLP